MKGQRSNGISHVITPNPYQGYSYQHEKVANWKAEHDLEKIEEILIKRNWHHFRQALGTPFTNGEMRERIPFTADRVTAKEVLEDEDIEGPTAEATEIRRECRRKIRESEQEISIEERDGRTE